MKCSPRMNFEQSSSAIEHDGANEVLKECLAVHGESLD